jgi:hypothetical protein
MKNQKDILSDYVNGPERLEAALAGLAEKDLDIALDEASWTIREIVHHLADGDDIWKVFIKQAMGNPRSEFTLEWYWEIPQVVWAEHWAYGKRAIEPSLALLRASRAQIGQLLEHSPEAWGKSLRVCWPNGEKQDVSVGWVVAMQARHVEGHIEEIRKIREAHGI